LLVVQGVYRARGRWLISAERLPGRGAPSVRGSQRRALAHVLRARGVPRNVGAERRLEARLRRWPKLCIRGVD
jgi:hypothetical protein